MLVFRMLCLVTASLCISAAFGSETWRTELCETKARLSFADGVSFLSSAFVGGSQSSRWVAPFVHGYSSKQNASWWASVVAPGIQNHTAVVAIDMPGHGLTVPPVGLEKRMSSAGNVAAVEAFLRRAISGSLSAPRAGARCLDSGGRVRTGPEIAPEDAAEAPGHPGPAAGRKERLPKKDLAVLVGRSWGGGVVLRTLAKLAKQARPPPSGGSERRGEGGGGSSPNRGENADNQTESSELLDSTSRVLDSVKCVVLVAPAVPRILLEQLPARIRELPMLLVWSKDDPVVPFKNHERVLEAFTGIKRTLFFDTVVPTDAPPEDQWRGHAPEQQRPVEFQDAVLALLDAVEQTQSS